MTTIRCCGDCPNCLTTSEGTSPKCKFCWIDLNIKYITCPVCGTDVQGWINKCPNCNSDLQYMFDLYKRIFNYSQELFKADERFQRVTFERGKKKKQYSDEEIEMLEQQKVEEENELRGLINDRKQIYYNKVKVQEKKEKFQEIKEKYGSYKSYQEHIEEKKSEYNKKSIKDDFKRKQRRSIATAVLWLIAILLLLLSSCLW